MACAVCAIGRWLPKRGYVEHSAAFMAKLWQGTEGKLREMMAQGDGSAQARAVLADDIARMTADYLQHQMLTRRDQLMAEQAFHQAALINPRLAVLVRAHQQIFLQGAGQIFEVLGSTQPQQNIRPYLMARSPRRMTTGWLFLRVTCTWCWPLYRRMQA